MNPKISVITPIFNVQTHIAKCVHSLLSQTLENVEYIFIDDASRDNSIGILKQVISNYAHRQADVKIIELRENVGVTAARELAYQACSGEYIIHCDSDDWIESTMLSDMYEHAIKNNADIVYCDFYIETEHASIPHRATRFSSTHRQMVKNYIGSSLCVLWNKLIKKELYQNIPFPTHIPYGEDLNMTIKMMHKANNIAYLPKHLYHYNKKNSLSITNNLSERTMQGELDCMEDLYYYFASNNDNVYEKELCWRILKAKQEWILNPQHHSKFMAYLPNSHKHILSCPFINKKLKIMMWCLTHHLTFATASILHIRKIKNRIL